MRKLKSHWNRNKLRITTIVTILLGLIEFGNIYVALKVNVTSNDECLWVGKNVNSDSVAYFFNYVKKDGVSWKAGIRDGDQLIKIENHLVRNDQQAQLVLNTIESGKFASYIVKKPDGKLLHTKVQIKKLINFGSLTFNISALFWLIIGFLVYSAKPSGKQQKLFFLLGVFFVLSTLFNFFPQSAKLIEIIKNYPVASLILYILASIGTAGLPFLFLYFIWNFFKPLNFAQKSWVKILFIIIPLLLVIYSLSIIPDFISLNLKAMNKTRVYINLVAILNWVTNSIAGITLVVLYFKEKNKQNRKPILIIIFSFILAIIVQVYIGTIAPNIADTIFNSPEYYAPVILLTLIPIIFAYAIFKYHLLDVSTVVKNTIIYGAATATIAGIYYLTVYLLGQGISSFFGQESQSILAAVFFLIFAFVFQSTKDQFQYFITRRFYPEQIAFQNILLKFSNEIATVVGIDNILDTTVKTFTDSLKINKFGILLEDKSTKKLVIARAYGIENTDCAFGQESIQKVYEQKLKSSEFPEIGREDFNDAFAENSYLLIKEEIYTIVPLVIKSRIIGTLCFGLKYSGSQFSGKDIEQLYAAANQLAIAVENARLYKSEVEKEKIEHDLELAKNIQKRLLPSFIPSINNFDICGMMIPAMQVGGDYYDLIQINEHKVFVTVGDVSGKGLSASLYMAKLQTIIQLYCKEGSTPKEILTEANKLLYESLDAGSFITLTLALFDKENMKMKLCRAGHLPLLFFENGESKLIKTKGIALGLDNGPLFEKNLEELEIDLKSGQIFAFFSDGISEAMNENNELFGEESLLDIFEKNYKENSDLIMEKIENRILQFRGKAEQHDDMTMVIVKIN